MGFAKYQGYPAPRIAGFPFGVVNDGGGSTVVNRAYLIPAFVGRAARFTRFNYGIFAAAGNYDYGVYDISGNRLFSIGTTLVPAAGLKQDVVDLSFNAGVYLLAIAFDNAGAQFWGSSTHVAVGSVLVADAVGLPLPAVIVPARPTTGVVIAAPMLALAQ